MTTCPRCRQPIRYERFGIYLPALKSRIVDAIAAAGDLGISADELISTIWGVDRSNTNCVKSHVQQINEVLYGTGVRITWGRNGRRRGLYYLTRGKRAVA